MNSANEKKYGKPRHAESPEGDVAACVPDSKGESGTGDGEPRHAESPKGDVAACVPDSKGESGTGDGEPRHAEQEVIRIRHLSKTFGKNVVLRDIDFSVSAGDVTCIIGASGSGKSTLLRCINLLETPTSGEILYHGTDIAGPGTNAAAYRARVGMVFQNFNLFNNMTVLQNCMIGQTKVLKKDKETAKQDALAYLEKVGMAPYINAKPRQLSGGQKQRVAIARALAMEPELLLFDEPTSALDPQMVGEVLDVMKRLVEDVPVSSREARKMESRDMQNRQKAMSRPASQIQKANLGQEMESRDMQNCQEAMSRPASQIQKANLGQERESTHGLTMIIVTHEMAFARDVSSHVVYMADGVIEEEGSPEQIFSNPQNPKTREFLSRFMRG